MTEIKSVDTESEMFGDITDAVMSGLSDVNFTEDQQIDLCNAIAWAILQYDHNKHKSDATP